MTAYTKQNDLLLNNLTEFYQQDNYKQLNVMLSVLNGESKISLRIIDWFVTNYAKQHFTVYENEGERFFVWTRFRSAEDGYSKEMFDPYCRKDRIIIPYDETTQIVTTIGQLNFFKWAIMNNVIDYIVANYDDITKDMNQRLTQKNKHSITVDSLSSLSSTSSTYSTSSMSTDESLASGTGNNTKTRKKREELSVSACLSIRKEFVPIKITF